MTLLSDLLWCGKATARLTVGLLAGVTVWNAYTPPAQAELVTQCGYEPATQPMFPCDVTQGLGGELIVTSDQLDGRFQPGSFPYQVVNGVFRDAEVEGSCELGGLTFHPIVGGQREGQAHTIPCPN